jgi:type II secretory pathway pseudopilin PulG
MTREGAAATRVRTAGLAVVAVLGLLAAALPAAPGARAEARDRAPQKAVARIAAAYERSVRQFPNVPPGAAGPPSAPRAP